MKSMENEKLTTIIETAGKGIKRGVGVVLTAAMLAAPLAGCKSPEEPGTETPPNPPNPPKDDLKPARDAALTAATSAEASATAAESAATAAESAATAAQTAANDAENAGATEAEKAAAKAFADAAKTNAANAATAAAAARAAATATRTAATAARTASNNANAATTLSAAEAAKATAQSQSAAAQNSSATAQTQRTNAETAKNNAVAAKGQATAAVQAIRDAEFAEWLKGEEAKRYETLAGKITVTNVKFDILTPTTSLSQGGVNNTMKGIMRDLMLGQSEFIYKQYANVSGAFAYNIRVEDDEIAARFRYGGSNGDSMYYGNSPNFDRIADAICNQITNSADKATFKLYLDAYRKQSYIDQRGCMSLDGSAFTHQSELDALLAQLGNPLPGEKPKTSKTDPTEYYSVKEMLVNYLVKNIPVNCGDGRFNLLQQFEDWEEYKGRLDDYKAKGFDITGHVITQIQNKGSTFIAGDMTKKRSDIQTENGLYV